MIATKMKYEKTNKKNPDICTFFENYPYLIDFFFFAKPVKISLYFMAFRPVASVDTVSKFLCQSYEDPLMNKNHIWSKVSCFVWRTLRMFLGML